jgi:hypothetical protein
MAKTDDDFHCAYLRLFSRGDFPLLSRAALRLVQRFNTSRSLLNYRSRR